jgi:hypothetical protein
MRKASLLALGAACFVGVACGGSTATVPALDGGTADDGGGGADGGGGTDATGADSSPGSDGAKGDGSTTDTGSMVDGPSSCDALHMQVDMLRPPATMCCPTCNHAPCTLAVDDLCCKLTVDIAASAAVMQFESAVQAFKAAGCMALCPAIPCPIAPSNQCDPQTSVCVE